jgi:DNA-binding NtrC family response regulator
MREVYSLVVKAAAGSENVIISGESGTARRWWRAPSTSSAHARKPLHPHQLRRHPGRALESEFFGFSAAPSPGHTPTSRLPGRRGPLHALFDESASCRSTAGKLLRVLENFTYTPLAPRRSRRRHPGGAATQPDLVKHVEAGKMREDFFYRLYVIPIHLPPLRERRRTSRSLVEQLRGRAEVRPVHLLLPGYIIDALYSYDWPATSASSTTPSSVS